MRRVAMAVLLLVGVFVIGAVPGAAATMHAQRHEQTTTVAGETTTVAPTTIAPATTEVPTTTETPTTTEPATEPATTSSTTSSTTSTTVPPPATSSGSSSTPWGWIIAILAVIAVVLIVVLAVRRRSSSRAESEWKNAAASALRDANLTRDMLAGEAPSGDAEAATRLTAVRDAVERVASHFDQLATSSPNDEMRRNSIGVATSLRGYYFAVESEQMLHDAPTTPTADQLATADAAKRAGAAELDAAVAAIRAYVAPA